MSPWGHFQYKEPYRTPFNNRVTDAIGNFPLTTDVTFKNLEELEKILHSLLAWNATDVTNKAGKVGVWLVGIL